MEKNKVQKIIKALEYNKSLSSHEECTLFDKAVSDLAEEKNPSHIFILLSYFDDECDNSEMMYSIIHALESYPLQVYIDNLLKNLKVSFNKSPEHISRLFYGILNDPESLKYFIKKMGEYEEPVRSLLERIINISEKHAPLCIELLNKFEHKSTDIERRD